ncbi:unnamed protein product [Ceratitis capitata]|uniref:(Mediterranean fruit fly) hypothetical protein n=1 Tax=Ceratitis capitata TaxID=7213 RepID=A0A811ULL7_CERCA|nr:unnamed protein product [Ceratitis capitata]
MCVRHTPCPPPFSYCGSNARLMSGRPACCLAKARAMWAGPKHIFLQKKIFLSYISFIWIFISTKLHIYCLCEKKVKKKTTLVAKIMHLSLRGENGARLNSLSATTTATFAVKGKQRNIVCCCKCHIHVCVVLSMRRHVSNFNSFHAKQLLPFLHSLFEIYLCVVMNFLYTYIYACALLLIKRKFYFHHFNFVVIKNYI